MREEMSICSSTSKCSDMENFLSKDLGPHDNETIAQDPDDAAKSLKNHFKHLGYIYFLKTTGNRPH
jgi:hypothetical protein